MHTHSIDYDIPYLGRIKAQISHKPLDDDHILIVVSPEKLPKIFSMMPRAERTKQREIKVKRAFVEKWGRQLIEWSKEPAAAPMPGSVTSDNIVTE